ncbi:MAG TPA: ribosome silencing factor [Candidatus Dormibacteraeota bacterium]|nr:ribosome silencing factor [Candidatus Dormibacteraeota bacterium]
MTSLQLSRLIGDAALDHKARGVVRVDLRQRTTFADYLVICEGDTDRQVRAIADAIQAQGRAAGIHPLATAGLEDASWACLDYDSVIAHVFLPGERAYYDLEGLWGPARALRPRRVPVARSG